MKQAMLSIPCTICPPSLLKNAPSLKLTNPVIAPRMKVVPIKQKSITCPGAFKKTYHCLVAPDARAVLKPAREGNTPPKLHLVSTVDNGPKFPKNCRIILRYNRRVTHPGSHGFPDATFDFIFAKVLAASRPTVTHSNASDHWPVTRSLLLH
jgi:hypothetical protein